MTRHLNVGGCAVVALAATLVDEVPCEDGGVLAVLEAVQGVLARHDGFDAVLVQLDGLGVGPEVIAALRRLCAVGVPASAGSRRIRPCRFQQFCKSERLGVTVACRLS